MKNAPAILFPFLREQAYALSIRCGFPPFILPLIQLPSIQKASSS
jgi:preprotein translocase subunit SecB